MTSRTASVKLRPRAVLRASLAAAVLLCLKACGGAGQGDTAAAAQLSAAAALGELIFKDASLSASGQMSCQTCHDPARGHASPFSGPVAFGGALRDQPGTRVPPAIRYLRFNKAFSLAADGSGSGGFTWDGRADSLSAQARGPFLAANEMANADAAEVVSKLAKTPYAARFREVFGAAILEQPELAFERMVFALERYQIEDPDFAPFTSKFDAVTMGQAQLSAEEARGLAWFNRADKGNCAACHPSTKPADAPAALFTDFSYDSLGVPRNAQIPDNANALFFDLGLCDSGRGVVRARSDLCGAFKVPSLRNVGLRLRFFHNGRFTTLEDVVRFYVQRDLSPALFYSTDASSGAQLYDDLPVSLRGNVNRSEGPYNRGAAQVPALDEGEIADLVAFLKTLSDGWIR